MLHEFSIWEQIFIKTFLLINLKAIYSVHVYYIDSHSKDYSAQIVR